MLRPKYRIDYDKYVVIAGLEKLGWARTSGADWNLYWAPVQLVHRIFSVSSGVRLTDYQLINHFPTHQELTRKDLMAKNLRAYRKSLEAQGSPFAPHVDFVPPSFVLPAEQASFTDEVRTNPNACWIMKPAGGAQGRGICILNRAQQVRRWQQTHLRSPSLSGGDLYLASRYIERPLLVGGRKFDIRLYCLVVSYTPLKAYVYQQAFCRFCTERYEYSEDGGIDLVRHLTNVAVQKHADGYDSRHGNKWDLQDLKLYLASQYGSEACEALFERILFILVQSLKAVQGNMLFCRNAFECYGYDILIDADLKPWLIEVNASPSLTCSTDADRLMKCRLLTDVFKVVIPPGFPAPGRELGPQHRVVNVGPVEDPGDFRLLVDEFERPNACFEGWTFAR